MAAWLSDGDMRRPGAATVMPGKWSRFSERAMGAARHKVVCWRQYPEMRLATERLWLSRPLLSDAPQLLSFLGDAEAMRHTFALADLRACRRHIAGYECQRRNP
jgi:hypothetical protein